MAYEIRFVTGAISDLRDIRAFDRRRILDRIDGNLQHNPTQATRNQKILTGLDPDWEHLEPIWELRVGDFRVYYDVETEQQIVFVRAIRQKPPHQTTEASLHENDPSGN